MSRLEGKVLVAQGGGPTAVINQSVVGVTLEARKFTQVKAVYGAIHGVQGIVKEDFLDLTRETTHNLEQVAQTPSSALLSTRDKPDDEYCARMFKVMQKHDIRYFFYVGGNDSSDTVRIVNQHAEEASYEFRAIHIPKTIDNDLLLNDHCPGIRLGGAIRHPGVYWPESGQSRALRGVDRSGHGAPRGISHCVVQPCAKISSMKARISSTCPSGPFQRTGFSPTSIGSTASMGCARWRSRRGSRMTKGTPIALTLSSNAERDAHGNVQLSGTGVVGDLLADQIKSKLKIKRVRADTFGYLQRSFLGVVSDRDAHEAREVGEIAVQYAMWDNVDGSVVIRRPVLNYSVSYDLVPLESVAGKTRVMPDEFINAEGDGVTTAFLQLLPAAHRLQRARAPSPASSARPRAARLNLLRLSNASHANDRQALRPFRNHCLGDRGNGSPGRSAGRSPGGGGRGGSDRRTKRGTRQRAMRKDSQQRCEGRVFPR